MKRTHLVSAARLLALALFISVAAALLVYLLMRQKRAEQGQEKSKLQGPIVAVFNNTKYAHEVRGQVRFILTSQIDRSYQDGTHELEKVRLESFGKENDRHDIVTADRAQVSNPSDLDKLDAELMSNVVVQTSDGLTVKSEYLRYRQTANTVETDKPVQFEGRNFSGTATGLFLEADQEKATLQHDVDVTIQTKPSSQPSDSRGAAAGPADTRTDAERARRKAEKRRRKQLKRERKAKQKAAGDTRRGNSEKPATPLDVASSKKPTRIQSESAVIERKAHRVTLEGNVRVTQSEDEARAQTMVAFTDASNHIERIEASGDCSLAQKDRTELRAPQMNFFFGESHQLERGEALGGATSHSLGNEPPRETSADRMDAEFRPTDRGSVLARLTATGRAMVKIHPPNLQPPKNPTERQLTADVITLEFQDDGRNAKTADAIGNAILTVTPTRADPKADRKSISAPRMNAAFFDEGNQLRHFVATEGVRVQFESLVSNGHPPRITTSKHLTADFEDGSQDVDRLVQEGSFKYVEGDRNALAERAVYDGRRDYLELRGNRPMGWDDKSRTQADEIDYDNQNDETHARGDVRTTYYSRESTNDSAPFKNTKSPVFITAQRADAKNDDGVAVYTVNARGWQDDNFVKADRIELYQNDKRMVAIGRVESALYKVKRIEAAEVNGAPEPDDKPRKHGKRKANDSNDEAPGFAWADRMTYSDPDRLVHYEGSVKSRHGTDYLEAAVVDVYLQQETNEVDRMSADGSVVLIQPGRRGVGDHFTYTSEDGRGVLTGKTARVDDAEKGSTIGSQLTFYSRDDKIVVENQQGTGRVRTTHRMSKH